VVGVSGSALSEFSFWKASSLGATLSQVVQTRLWGIHPIQNLTRPPTTPLAALESFPAVPEGAESQIPNFARDFDPRLQLPSASFQHFLAANNSCEVLVRVVRDGSCHGENGLPRTFWLKSS